MCLLLALIVSIKAAKCQNNDTLFIKAKIESIDSVGYYIVIRVISEEKKKVTILSPIDAKNSFIKNLKHRCVIKVGCNYNFILQIASRIKTGEGNYLFVSLKSFDFNGKHFLDAGELPYAALNMYRFDIYN